MTPGFVRVFSHSNALLVSHVYNVLQMTGMVAELRNMTLGGGAGELPINECEPQVWVASHNVDRAGVLVQEALSGPRSTGPDWTCRECGEKLAGVFDTCWRCGMTIEESR